jgi:predicted DsbA family dithiol-disulfide isomerase
LLRESGGVKNDGRIYPNQPERRRTIVSDLEGAVCGVDGCVSETGLADKNDSSVDSTTTLYIEVVSDAICPWCWVGKRRLGRAVAALSPEIQAVVSWRPFELNPSMPKGGLDRRTYRSRKFGSWERSQLLDAQVAAAGLSDGLIFRHDRIERTPNTLDAHRLIWLAGRERRQSDVVEGVFAAYFVDGRDVGDPNVLVDVGAAAGLHRARVEALFAADEGAAEVKQELHRAAALGVSGVPTVLVNGTPLFSGAIRTELMKTALRRAATHDRG